MQLSLKEKLEFLWQDFITFVEQGVSEGKYVEGFGNNFKELTKSDILSFRSGEMPRIRAQDELFIGKIVLNLRDVAVLLDAELDDFIEGDYLGLVSMLKKFIDNQDSTIFNQVNVAMVEMSGSSYMPYLSEKGKRKLQEDFNKYKSILPSSVLCFPYYYDFFNKQISWTDDTDFKGEIPSKDDIINNVIVAENERLKDIALLMLNNDNLKIIGFDRFL